MVLTVFGPLFGAIFFAFASLWPPHARTGQTLGEKPPEIKLISLRAGEPPFPGESAMRQTIHLAFPAAGSGRPPP